jgi:hypothetical protein
MTRRRKTQTPIALLWTRRDQRRFIDAVEKFQSLVNDAERFTRLLDVQLSALLAKPARRRAAKNEPESNGDASNV